MIGVQLFDHQSSSITIIVLCHELRLNVECLKSVGNVYHAIVCVCVWAFMHAYILRYVYVCSQWWIWNAWVRYSVWLYVKEGVTGRSVGILCEHKKRNVLLLILGWNIIMRVVVYAIVCDWYLLSKWQLSSKLSLWDVMGQINSSSVKKKQQQTYL